MPAQEIELADGVDECQYFLDKAWSDGLPVVAPTAGRLAWMMTGTRRNADENLDVSSIVFPPLRGGAGWGESRTLCLNVRIEPEIAGIFVWHLTPPWPSPEGRERKR